MDRTLIERYAHIEAVKRWENSILLDELPSVLQELALEINHYVKPRFRIYRCDPIAEFAADRIHGHGMGIIW